MSVAFSPHYGYEKTSAFATSDNTTMMAWVYPTSLPSSGYRNIVCSMITGAFGVGFDLHGVGGIGKWSIGTQPSDFDGSNATVNTWAHLALIRNGNTKTLYLNGIQDVTGSDAGTNQTILGIGATRNGSGNASSSFDGRIAFIKIWKRVLSVEEINKEMRQGLPVDPTNLYAYYPFWSINDLNDYGPNGVTLSIMGTPTGSVATADHAPVPWMLQEPELVYVVSTPPPSLTPFIAPIYPNITGTPLKLVTY